MSSNIESGQGSTIIPPLTSGNDTEKSSKNLDRYPKDEDITGISSKALQTDPHTEPLIKEQLHQTIQLNADPLQQKLKERGTLKSSSQAKDDNNAANHVAGITSQQSKIEMIKQAISKSDLDMLNRIMKFPDDLEIRDEDYNTPLINAIRQNKLEVVRFFIESHHADIEAQGFNDSTPLMFACEMKEGADITKYLLDRQANVNGENFNGTTPLHFASIIENEKIVDLLLKANARASAADLKGQTPLHIASFYGNEKIVELLLQAKAEISKADIRGNSPLMTASRHGQTHVVKLLLANNADPHMRTKDAYKAIHIAYYSNHPDIVALLKPFELNENFLSFFNEERLLCHRFGLAPEYQTETKPGEAIKANFGGLYSGYAMQMLLESLKSHTVSSEHKQKFPELNLSLVREIMAKSVELTNIQTNIDGNIKEDDISKIKNTLESSDIVAFSTGWQGHATGIIISQSLGILIKCDRSNSPKDRGNSMGMRIYKIGNKEKLGEGMQKLISNKNSPEYTGYKFFNEDIDEFLKLTPFDTPILPHKCQFVGNCAWAAAKMLYRGIIYLMLLNKNYSTQKAEKISRDLYKDFTTDDRYRSLIAFIKADKALRDKFKSISSEKLTIEGIIPQQILECAMISSIRDRLIDCLKLIFDEYPDIKNKYNEKKIMIVIEEFKAENALNLFRLYEDEKFLASLTQDKKNMAASDLIKQYREFKK